MKQNLFVKFRTCFKRAEMNQIQSHAGNNIYNMRPFNALIRVTYKFQLQNYHNNTLECGFDCKKK